MSPTKRRLRRRQPPKEITLSFRLSPGLLKAINRTAARKGIDVSTFIRDTVAHYTDYRPLVDEDNEDGPETGAP